MLSLPIIVIFSHQIWLGKQLFRFNKWTLMWFIHFFFLLFSKNKIKKIKKKIKNSQNKETSPFSFSITTTTNSKLHYMLCNLVSRNNLNEVYPLFCPRKFKTFFSFKNTEILKFIAELTKYIFTASFWS
jgi:hypothetical protein